MNGREMKMESINHEISFLNFDETLLEQKSLQQFPHQWIDFSDVLHSNGFCEPQSLLEIRKRLKAQPSGTIHFIGNGNYHYVSFLLLERMQIPFSLVLFDHHSDMMEDGGMMSCGSWVKHALQENRFLNKVLIIGVNETDYTTFISHPSSYQKVTMIPERKLQTTPINQIVNEIRSFLHNEKSIYISIDKDVLNKHEVMTTWDQGSMSIVQLLLILNHLANHYSILGMDVCGEYKANPSNLYDKESGELIRMNEIVNKMLLAFALENRLINNELIMTKLH